MENTISFNTKFGWISASETNNKITKVQFGRKNWQDKTKAEKFRKIFHFKRKNDKLDIKIFQKKFNSRIWQEKTNQKGGNKNLWRNSQKN